MKLPVSAVVILVLASVLHGCADAPVNPHDQAQCGPQPTEAQITDAVQTYIKNVNWKDPDSVQVRNVRMQECRSIYNGLINGGGHTIGWEIDFEVNAKNSYGGYTGYQLKSIIRTTDGNIHWDATQ